MFLISSCLIFFFNSTTAKDVRSRWRSLRDKFVREKKIILNKSRGNKSLEAVETEWPLMENMSFIWQHIVHRRKRRSKLGKDDIKHESLEITDNMPENAEWYVALDVDRSDRSLMNHFCFINNIFKLD